MQNRRNRNYVRIADAYADRVRSGKRVECQEIRQAVDRYLADRKSGKWEFRADRAQRVGRFLELLPHIKGKWVKTGELLKLAPWQCFIIANLFGFFNPKTGLRRYRSAYIEVGRKNGKTMFAAGIGLYMVSSDGEPGAEVYCGAKTGTQAREVFDAARAMLIRSGGAKALGCKIEMHVIRAEGFAKFQPVASESEALDGKSPHCIITDELHAHKTPDVYNALDLGTGAREQPLHISITTAGQNRAGICWAIRSKTLRILSGTSTDETHFGVIYRALESDNTSDELTWRKANPNLGVSISLSNFKSARKKALDTPSLYAAWLNKRLNIWTGSAEPWLRPGVWAKAADPTLSPHDFIGVEGWRCVLGVDLSTRVDLSALALLFWRGNEVGVPVGDGDEFRSTLNEYAIFSHSFVPSERAAERLDDGYAGFIERGECTSTEGDVIDRRLIDRDLLDWYRNTGALQIGFDPYDATHSIQGLQAVGVNCVTVRHTVPNLSPAMKELEAALLGGRVHHTGDQCLEWQMGAVTARPDERGNLYPRKEDKRNPRLRIDAAIAVLLCFSQVLSGMIEPEYWKGGVLAHELYE